MGSLFKTTMNTRALPTGNLRYIRSDVPLELTEDEIRWLLENGITTAVDLRSAEETQKKPCCLCGKAGFTYINLPVTGGGGTPKSLEHLYEIYGGMLDAQMERIIDTIMNAGTGVIYFCTAGKDRTGVVSAVIMNRLGFSDEEIIADYMQSGENLLSMLKKYVSIHPEVDLNIVVPHRENMERLLKKLRGN
jgi:hypothetical protein